MKKILFYGYNMEMGGAERALINVMNAIKDEYEIDLILIQDKGVLMNEIPKEVNVMTIRKNNISYALFRYIPFFRKIKIRRMTSKKKYDTAVAFMEGRAATWLTDMNQMCKKVAWIHNDVNRFNIGISEREIKKTYSKIDRIAVVSKQSKDSFCKKYNISEDKVEVVYNLIAEEEIKEKSLEFDPIKDKFTFVNVAKMRPQKRHDRLLNAVKTLKDEGFNFQLWLIGNGPLEDDIKKMVDDLNISDYVSLLGLKTNPFPYIKKADFFVMSSDHEGYPLSLLEALLLKTPVITTDVSGAEEILKNDKYGIICDVSLEGLTNAMRNILKNQDYSQIEKNLSNYKGANGGIVSQLKELFEPEK